ncbi:50S ribosomal protein L2 [bacterium BMS3Bbin03]|nr:50S ribosomal protein L2 [bacterium BMS3Bbin03]HDL78523.1 50S ribosomal protein L2 [Bacteroidota bacterium]HDZ12424.1 50S ribosomal protein L2 [Bacteroidota bacterium]
MPLKSYKPVTPSMRFRKVVHYTDITDNKPEPSLVKPLHKTGGRNNLGRVTIRHRGGGHKRSYRIVDFKRNKDNIPARVAAIHYDPNRSANLALLFYRDGEKRYILAPNGIKVNDILMSGESVEIRVGNTMPLGNIPLGSFVHNAELKPGKGGQLARSAGSYAQLVAKEGKFAHLKLPSGEVRLVHLNCRATIGQIGNLDHENIVYGKAGAVRWLGRRSHVRGVAMNPVDHPMGGGEGKASGGHHPTSPWGWKTKGRKTRKKKKSDNYILKKRK